MKVVKSLVGFLLISLSATSYGLSIDGNTVLNLNSFEPWLNTYDQSTLNANENADIAFLHAYNQSNINIHGSEVSWIYGYDQSNINIYGGEIGWIHGYDNSTINITSGDISWLKLYSHSVTNISNIDDLSWLLVSDNAIVNIYGSDFSYQNGHLSGRWENGMHFSFWALEENNLFSVNNRNVLPDNIVLRSVSEPSNIALLLVGLSLLIRRKKAESE